jgi:two-component system, sensor histidine kinase and response regulator
MTTQKSLGLNVLLVDDNKINLQVITLMLHSAGCTVETAANGLEALDLFNPIKHNVVLMDIMMPFMDGITAMKQLKTRYEKEMKPVIAITANVMAGNREKYLAEGFDAYLTKPISLQNLRAELEHTVIRATQS